MRKQYHAIKDIDIKLGDLDITQLPYSFSYDNYGVRKEIWNTLILQQFSFERTYFDRKGTQRSVKRGGKNFELFLPVRIIELISDQCTAY